MLTVMDLQTIASFGGGMIIDAKKFTVLDLQNIASFASTKQARITIKNAGLLTSLDLQTIASFSKGCVVFDFCS
ncbi:hypothetical protein E0508_06105 [Salmonella enterica subsp. enterica serovar Kingston]|nr:hypothetical protein [Salmonella enterica subsp. enterica serovar Kingston]EBH2366676.1 hypothetical protein [Salmonella enterica]EDH3563421.1 hypothetical protein [Salmonella enterica subsp. enterica serovar Durham]EDQ6046483.1 hypothetical protein [Salmonella enterica subsp. enterica]EBV0924081.1 hypothetical protein [Salmonella enterica subsp. enterica serovar Kingston]